MTNMIFGGASKIWGGRRNFRRYPALERLNNDYKL